MRRPAPGGKVGTTYPPNADRHMPLTFLEAEHPEESDPRHGTPFLSRGYSSVVTIQEGQKRSSAE